jgi:hypothetical protein
MAFKYIVCVLVNNMVYFESMLKNMPKQSDKILFVFVNEQRLLDRTDKITDIANKYISNFKVIGSEKVNDFCLKNLKLSEQGQHFLNVYKMGMNILPQYYLFKKTNCKKILFLDDDILITSDLINIFENINCCSFVRDGMTGFLVKKDKQGNKIYYSNDVQSELINLWNNKNPIPQDILSKYVDNYFNSGTRIYVMNNNLLESYKNLLEKFFENKLLCFYFENWCKFNTDKIKGFFQDQNFENSFVCENDLYNFELGKYVRKISSLKQMPKNPKLLLNKSIVHYNIGSPEKNKIKNKKIEFLDILKQNGLIK